MSKKFVVSAKGKKVDMAALKASTKRIVPVGKIKKPILTDAQPQNVPVPSIPKLSGTIVSVSKKATDREPIEKTQASPSSPVAATISSKPRKEIK